MLESIWIENFKSYKTGQTLPLAPITLMIGANASGKSNAIEAFRFLSWFAGGEKLSTIKNRINDSEKIFRGEVRDLFCKNEKTFSLGVSFSEHLSRNFKSWEFTIKFSNEEVLNVKNEKLVSRKNTKKIFYLEKSNAPIKLLSALNNNSIELYELISQNKLVIPEFQIGEILIDENSYNVDSDASVLRIFDNVIEEKLKDYLEESGQSSHYHALMFFSDLFIVINTFSTFFNFYDFVPSKMRNESISASRLNQNGQNLSGVLYNLWENKEDHKSDILKFIRSLPEQDFKSLKFYKDHRDRVELALVENFGGKEQESGIELLSDGTMRVLGIAAAILSAPDESILVIEEIDNGIHPSRAKYLLETMFYFAEKKKLKLLLSTHNPALMDALPDKALGDVVFAYRDPKEGDSRLVRLSDLDDYVGLVSQGPLGELVTQGIVDRFVKNPISKDDKKQKALSWLNEMRGASNE